MVRGRPLSIFFFVAVASAFDTLIAIGSSSDGTRLLMAALIAFITVDIATTSGAKVDAVASFAGMLAGVGLVAAIATLAA